MATCKFYFICCLLCQLPCLLVIFAVLAPDISNVQARIPCLVPPHFSSLIPLSFLSHFLFLIPPLSFLLISPDSAFLIYSHSYSPHFLFRIHPLSPLLSSQSSFLPRSILFLLLWCGSLTQLRLALLLSAKGPA